jgi:hypothetical protein
LYQGDFGLVFGGFRRGEDMPILRGFSMSNLLCEAEDVEGKKFRILKAKGLEKSRKTVGARQWERKLGV